MNDNVAANGSSLQKTGGCSGCPDATAVSEQQISGNGAVEFVASESATLRFVGLSSGGIGTGAGDLTFAVRLQGGVAEVRESGAYKTELGFAAGDRFRIAVSGGTVTYAKNGAVFYTSGNQATYSVRVHAIFFDGSATIQDVAIGGGSGAAIGCGPEHGGPSICREVFDSPRHPVALEHRSSRGDADRAAESDEVKAKLL